MTERLPIILAGILLLATALLGGASRATEAAQMPLRLIALLVLMATLWSPPTVRLARYKPLFWFAGACAAVAVIQLVPLPAGLWEAMPGRAFYADIARQVGIAQTARPLSLAPDLTMHALLSLILPLAVLATAAAIPAAQLDRLLWFFGGVILIGLVLGFAQAAGGAGSPLRLYAVTNRDAMVGLFANRNHHALALAMGLPILFAMAGLARARGGARAPLALLGCALGGAIIVLALLLTGSRGGLLAGALGALAGAVLYAILVAPRARSDADASASARLPARGGLMAIGGITATIALLGVAFARLPAMQRLLHADPAEEVRSQLFWPAVELATAMFPLGGGIGAFDQLFRRFEPDGYLRLTYQNQAHMEPLQVAIEAGLPGIALMAALLWWWFRRTRTAWRQPRPRTTMEVLPRLASILIALQLVISLADYPLRTPLHAAMFVIAAVWLELGPRAFQSGRTRRR